MKKFLLISMICLSLLSNEHPKKKSFWKDPKVRANILAAGIITGAIVIYYYKVHKKDQNGKERPATFYRAGIML